VSYDCLLRFYSIFSLHSIFSHSLNSNSDELIRLRTYKPKPGERRFTDSIPPPLLAVRQDVLNVEKSTDLQSENDAEDPTNSSPKDLPPDDPPPTSSGQKLGEISDDTTDEDSNLAVGIENGEAEHEFPLEDYFPEDDFHIEQPFSFSNFIETHITVIDQSIVEMPSSIEGTRQVFVC
jgi:hypothetical protein